MATHGMGPGWGPVGEESLLRKPGLCRRGRGLPPLCQLRPSSLSSWAPGPGLVGRKTPGSHLFYRKGHVKALPFPPSLLPLFP